MDGKSRRKSIRHAATDEVSIMMNEMEEIIKESGAKPPKRKIGKKEKITIIATVLVIAILIGAYVAMILTAPPPEKYWKPEKELRCWMWSGAQ